MSTSQCKQSLISGKVQNEITRFKKPAEESAGASALDLAISLTYAEVADSSPGVCHRCRGYRNPRQSLAQYPNVFCSIRCEQDFIRAALAALTLDDCIRIHERLDALLNSSATAAAL
ncbi:MAG TPA: hypothetical protein VMU24_07310 [Candidatus Acidoferrales bacterium]|nr:hypothetical protein [Candidatus Acidoferrales bacterium]